MSVSCLRKILIKRKRKKKQRLANTASSLPFDADTCLPIAWSFQSQITSNCSTHYYDYEYYYYDYY